MNEVARPLQAARATPNDLAEFLAANPGIEELDALFIDISGVARGKRYPISEAAKVFEGGMQMPRSIYFIDVTGENEDVCGMGFSDGDPDFTAHPIAGSLALSPWSGGTRSQVLMSMEDGEGGTCRLESRDVLNRVAARFSQLGLTPVTAVELEFYLLDPERDASGRPLAPNSPVIGVRESLSSVYGIDGLDRFHPVIDDLTKGAAAQGLPGSAASSEFAPGQYEINLAHKPDPLASGDHAAMLKHLVRSVALSHGMRASFMAKPFLDLTGSGTHIHISVVDQAGSNVFDGGGEAISDTMRHALGGLQETMADCFAIFAPNLNAYRRFAPNKFVPVNRSWGFNNRSVALRIPAGGGSARRIEHRVAGADANSYLVLAAILAGIHHGIANKLEPSEPSSGNACGEVDTTLPASLPAALDQFEHSEIMRSYFGADYVRVYAEAKRREYEKFLSVVTPREYDWYL